MQDREKKYAFQNHRLIEPIVNELYSLSSEEIAEEKIEILRDFFIFSSKYADENNPNDAAVLWIRGYSVTPEEDQLGYVGNYARILPKKITDIEYSVCAEKIIIDLKYHPIANHKKKYDDKDKPHPNWGHPVLRQIKKGSQFSYEEAKKKLLQLQKDYEKIALPGIDKLFIIIHDSHNNPPIQKYVLTIKLVSDDKFVINYEINKYKKKSEDDYQ